MIALDYPEIDLAQREPVCASWCAPHQPEVIVNATAYTAVDRAESEPELAMAINARAPGLLAEEALRLGALLIHYSTDYVFDGNKGSPYLESDLPNPLGVYGQSKLEGERAIQAVGGDALILRTSWVYSLRRDSFVTKVLQWSRQQPMLRLVTDQVSNPTWARMLAEATALLLVKGGDGWLEWLGERRGLYHLAGSGYASRLEWAQAILKLDPKAGRTTGARDPASPDGRFPHPGAAPAVFRPELRPVRPHLWPAACRRGKKPCAWQWRTAMAENAIYDSARRIHPALEELREVVQLPRPDPAAGPPRCAHPLQALCAGHRLDLAQPAGHDAGVDAGFLANPALQHGLRLRSLRPERVDGLEFLLPNHHRCHGQSGMGRRAAQPHLYPALFLCPGSHRHRHGQYPAGAHPVAGGNADHGVPDHTRLPVCARPAAAPGCFSLGLGLLISTSAVYFPDVAEMYQIVLSAWFYLTPIIYPIEALPEPSAVLDQASTRCTIWSSCSACPCTMGASHLGRAVAIPAYFQRDAGRWAG